MAPYLPDLLARPVPRYTSYPTALEFHDDVGAGDLAEALTMVDPGSVISAYIHIPYCEKICWYCGCNTGAANRNHRLAAYLEALEGEIALVGKHLAGRATLGRIAFGGGSPNAIPPVSFVRLVDRLLTMIGGDRPDISVEVDPRCLTEEWIAVMAATGVTRVSMGIQSFSPTVQAAIGRVQPVSMIEQAMATLRRYGIEAINFDLMYGLPGQDLAVLDATLDDVIGLRPSRIALFGYAHLPSQFPRQRRIDDSALPGAELRFQQAERGHERLVAAGYQAIGFDHFALPDDALAVAAAQGTMRRNFQGFTEDAASVLIGLGASAISSFPGLLAQNEKNPGRYRMIVSGGRLPATRGVMRGVDDRRRAAIIEAILCRGRALIEQAELLAHAKSALAAYEERGLIAWHGKRLELAPHAQPYARLIAAVFDRHRCSSVPRSEMSQAV